MPSDEEDAQPKTLAERIARLGLDSEATTRPSSRTSVYGASTRSIETPATVPASHGKPPPPIAPKPQFSARQQRDSAETAGIQRQVHTPTPPPATIPTPTKKHSGAVVLAQQSARASLSPHAQARSNGLGTGSGPKPASASPVEDEPAAVSIKDRIRSLALAQSNNMNATRTAEPLPAQNPFASPELQDSDRETFGNGGLDGRPLSPLAPLPPPVHALGMSAPDSSRSMSLPPLPPPPPSMQSHFSSNVQTPLNLYSSASSYKVASPLQNTTSLGRGSSALPPPPQPPQPPPFHRPT
ncbi:hypothetical protein GGH99_006897, partial [Coemansia sp. RSA 1285]